MDADNDLQMYHTLVKGVVGDSNAVSLSDKQALRGIAASMELQTMNTQKRCSGSAGPCDSLKWVQASPRGDRARMVESARRLSAGDAQGAQDCPGPGVSPRHECFQSLLPCIYNRPLGFYNTTNGHLSIPFAAMPTHLTGTTIPKKL